MRPLTSLFVLPLLLGAAARADDAPPTAPPAKPPVDANPVKPADAPKPADETKPAAPTPPAAEPKPVTDAKPAAEAKAPASAIAWMHDYDAAKTKAASEKKGLFVYLTPSWFT